MRHNGLLDYIFTTCAALVFFMSFFMSSRSHAAENAMDKVIMKVFLNTEDKGEFFLLRTKEGAVLFSRKDLLDMGLRNLIEGAGVTVGGEEYVPLNSLLHRLVYEVDEKELALRMTAGSELFEKNVIDLSSKPEGKVSFLKYNTAFLNYGLNYAMDNDLKLTTLSMPLEAGLSIEGALMYSNFSYSKSSDEERFVRLLTNITVDDSASVRRFVAGDFSASSGNLGGSASLGGLSISRNFSLSPYFTKSSGLDVSGVLTTPSEVEVYINENLVKSESLQPGEFTLLNVPNATGSGNVSLVIKDGFGKVEKIIIPFYLSTALLKPGVSEYDYNLGFKRENFGQESLDYGDPAFMGFHRMGLAKTFTAGLRAEADRDVFNAGPSAVFLLGRAGEVDVAAAHSNYGGTTGYGWTLGYGYAGRSFNWGASGRGFSREYSNINITPLQDRQRFERTFRLGYNHKGFGSISAALTRTDNYIGTDRIRTSVFYSTRLTKDISLFMTAGRTKADTVMNDAFVGLIFLLGQGSSGGINYRSQDTSSGQAAFVQKSAPTGVGAGYRLQAERSDPDSGESEFKGNGFLQYNSTYGIYSADVRDTAGQMSYNLNGSGGVAFVDWSAYPTRPINDSFAVVKVGGLEGVKVSSSNQVVAMTDKKGVAVVPNLISYYGNNISIEDTDIPVNYSISELSRHVSTPYRGGGIVSFETARLQGFGGRFFIVQNGEKKPAEYWGLEMRIKDISTEAVVGKGGEFYLENILPGIHSARLFLADKECRFDILIPESDDMMVDMGEVSCEIH